MWLLNLNTTCCIPALRDLFFFPAYVIEYNHIKYINASAELHEGASDAISDANRNRVGAKCNKISSKMCVNALPASTEQNVLEI
jgi:hypothetical protein